MIKILRRLRVSTLLLLFIEIIIISTVIIFYYYDILQFQSVFSFAVMVGLLVSILIFNIIFNLSAFSALLKNRQTKDLQTAELLGSDIPEAYRYAGLGIIITDQDDVVIWVNEVIQDLDIQLIEKNIFTWKDELRQFIRDGKAKVNITIGGRIFEVKYLTTSHMFILKDISAYENVIDIYHKHSPVVGIVVLDNYEENAPAFDEHSNYISLIRTTVTAYFNGLGFVVRKIRNDSYYVVGNIIAFEKMKATKFSIIDTIFNLDKGQSRLITLSIGIAYGIQEDWLKLDASAYEAVELAVARGGNQGMIDDQHKKEPFGGYRLSQENEMKTAAKVRERNDKILRFMKDAQRIFVVGHLDTDMDSLGSALAIKTVADYFKVPLKIILDYQSTEKRTRAAVSSLFTVEENKEFFIRSEQAIQTINAKDLLIVVDVSRPALVVGNQILDKDIPTIVIDHHKRTDEFIAKVTMEPVIDTAASSATELVVDIIMHNKYFKSKELPLPTTYATIMLSGIYLDTNFYKLKTVGPRTFDASRYLIERGADTTKAHELLKEDYAEVLVINRVTASAQTIETGMLLATFQEEELNIDPSLIARVSNNLMEMRGVNAAFVIGKVTQDGQVKISCRSDGSINVGLIMEKLGGGGHFSMAGFQTKTTDTINNIQQKLITTIREYLVQAQQTRNEE
jgi:c-di-AMP phosphodiesterase-like protein